MFKGDTDTERLSPGQSEAQRRIRKGITSHSMIQVSLMPRGWVLLKPSLLPLEVCVPCSGEHRSQRKTLHGRMNSFPKTQTGKPKEAQREAPISHPQTRLELSVRLRQCLRH